jgi:hypothetical protein
MSCNVIWKKKKIKKMKDGFTDNESLNIWGQKTCII